MLKIVATTVLGLVVLAVLASSTEAAGRRRQCPPTYTYTYTVAAAPAAPVATAQSNVSGQGYRTFSYQPAPTTLYRTFSQPAGGRSSVRAFENGANKSLGRGY
jgi:hypothetical protein